MASLTVTTRNPKVCCFLLQIRDIVIETSVVLQNSKKETKYEEDSGSCGKKRNRENRL